MEFAPGERWSYRNSGYVLLGAIIEQASGMSYADFIEQRIFAPLGMRHSYYYNTAQIIPGRVAGYARGKTAFQNAEYLSMSQPYAAGSLASSVDVLVRWDAALDTDQLVKQSTLKRSFTAYTLKHGESTGYGYGWLLADYAGHAIVWHDGNINGFHTIMLHLPQDSVFPILTNRDDSTPSGLALEYRGSTPSASPIRSLTAITLPAGMLAAYGALSMRPMGAKWSSGRKAISFMSNPLACPSRRLRLPPRLSFDQRRELYSSQVYQNRWQGDCAAPARLLLPGGWRKRRTSPCPLDAKPLRFIRPSMSPMWASIRLRPPSASDSVEEGKSIVEPTGQTPTELFPESETRFFLTTLDVQIEFQRNATGTVTGLVFYQDGQAFPGQKIK